MSRSLTPPRVPEGLRPVISETDTGICLDGTWFDSVPGRTDSEAWEHGIRRTKSAYVDASEGPEEQVELGLPGPLGIEWAALFPDEIFAVFEERRLGLDWGSRTGEHVEDRSHVVVEALKPAPAAAEARAQGITPGCYLMRIGDERSSQYHFDDAVARINAAVRRNFPHSLVHGA